MAPKRVIEGQATKMGRTLHGIAYHPGRDEIAVNNPTASAVLVFRGGANGNEAPVRMIQGPKTKLVFPHSVAVDVQNNELIVLDPGSQSVLVFPFDANGNVAPLRILNGLNTRLRYVVGAAVDPVNNLLIVATTPTGGRPSPGGPPLVNGLAIFNRTDSGDVAPRSVIAGPKTGIQLYPWQVQVHQGQIYAAIANFFYRRLYSNITLRPGLDPATEIVSPWQSARVGFIGVWKVTDNGDVAPMAIIRGPGSGLIHSAGIALNLKHKEIYSVDSVRNGLLTFLVPEFFQDANERAGAKPGF
jgi:DNA-binding beta-propeller fold protein YncE